MQLHLTSQECQELLDLVRERAGELSGEIHHANVSSYRDRLRARKRRLVDLHEKLYFLRERENNRTLD